LKSILCISGWGQNFKSLETSFSENILQKFNISSLNYSSFEGFLKLKDSYNFPPNPDVVIGWSLGGQIALRLIQNKIFTPKLLVLIAPPFQMVKDSRIQAGMSLKTYNDFFNNLSQAPDATLKKFSVLSIMNDKNKSQIIKNLEISDENHQKLLIWLQELKDFSCFDFDFTNIPPTLFYIGAGDMVVHSSQSKYFADRINDFELHIFDNCGHAPQLSNKELFNEILTKKLKSLNLIT
jgi:pimeloyl-[acyl-carrier protein] methyl ester esterase